MTLPHRGVCTAFPREDVVFIVGVASMQVIGEVVTA